MIDLTILRLETNYFLYIIELALGDEDRGYAEEALNVLINYFFLNKGDSLYLGYIEVLQKYLETISTCNNEDCSLLKNNIPTMLKLIDIVKQEQL